MVIDHDTALRAPAFLGGGAAPVVLRRVDQRFVEGLFRDLRRGSGLSILKTQIIPAKTDTEALLYQPVHRAFQLVLVEAYCKVPGEPRLDPRKIDSAGLVMRRRVPARSDSGKKERPWAKDGQGQRQIVYLGPERWLSLDDEIRGWVPCLGREEQDQDPDPRRRPVARAGNAVLDALLEVQRHPDNEAHGYEEVITKLYVAPPAVCESLGRTVLFGVVPTTDTEAVEAGGRIGANSGAHQAGQDALDLEEDQLALLIPPWLRHTSSHTNIPSQVRGRKLRVADIGAGGLHNPVIQYLSGNTWTTIDNATLPEPSDAPPSTSMTDLAHFERMFWQCHAELAAFEQNNTASASLRSALRAVSLTMPDGSHQRLDDFLREGARVLVLRDVGATVQIPSEWPLLSAAQAKAILDAVGASYKARFATIAGQLRRFDRHDARYQLRAFLRVKRDDGCPPELVWSDSTSRFRIARWYEGGPPEAIIPTIELPSVTPTLLRQIKPNVSFKVPRSLFNFLRNNTPGDLLEGKGKNNTIGPEFHWICGFNIPIITICAFILLFIILIVLNIVFWWLPFVRICIPIPVIKGGPFDPDEG